MKALIAIIALAGCTGEAMTTKEGCPVYMTELMQAATQACVQAYYEEQARQRGGVVTNCTPTASGGMSCATY